MKLSPPVLKPKKIVVPLATGLAWRGGDGYRYEEKLDGRFHVEELPGCILTGELMPDGRFYAFDVAENVGESLRQFPLSERLRVLDLLTFQHNLLRPACGSGGEFLEAVLAGGGEGVVAKPLDGLWGVPMWACKRVESFVCVVTAIGPNQSVQIAAPAFNMLPVEELIPRGHCPLRGGKADQVRVGSIIKVEGYGLTRAGLIREPRPDKDTATSWLVQY